jgi:5-methyltetrahydrofolate--homocysteine methyltransferase
MLRGSGFEVEDLGVDVPVEKFVETAKGDAKVLCLSALLTTTMPQMPKVIEAIKEAGADDVKILIGGAPVTEKYAEEIGADGYAADAASAVGVAKDVLGV